jgi:hypothetical protein
MFCQFIFGYALQYNQYAICRFIKSNNIRYIGLRTFKILVRFIEKEKKKNNKQTIQGLVEPGDAPRIGFGHRNTYCSIRILSQSSKCKNEQRAITLKLGITELRCFCSALLFNEISLPTNFILILLMVSDLCSGQSSKCKNEQ